MGGTCHLSQLGPLRLWIAKSALQVNLVSKRLVFNHVNQYCILKQNDLQALETCQPQVSLLEWHMPQVTSEQTGWKELRIRPSEWNVFLFFLNKTPLMILMMSHSPAKKLGLCSSDFSQSDGAGDSVLICQNTVITPLVNGDTFKKRTLCSLHWGTCRLFLF